MPPMADRRVSSNPIHPSNLITIGQGVPSPIVPESGHVPPMYEPLVLMDRSHLTLSLRAGYLRHPWGYTRCLFGRKTCILHPPPSAITLGMVLLPSTYRKPQGHHIYSPHHLRDVKGHEHTYVLMSIPDLSVSMVA